MNIFYIVILSQSLQKALKKAFFDLLTHAFLSSQVKCMPLKCSSSQKPLVKSTHHEAVGIGVYAKGAGGWQPPQFQIIRAKRQKFV